MTKFKDYKVWLFSIPFGTDEQAIKEFLVTEKKLKYEDLEVEKLNDSEGNFAGYAVNIHELHKFWPSGWLAKKLTSIDQVDLESSQRSFEHSLAPTWVSVNIDQRFPFQLETVTKYVKAKNKVCGFYGFLLKTIRYTGCLIKMLKGIK